MSDWIYVVQTLTDGDYGFPLDRVAEIGICRVDLDSKNVESMYDSRIMLDEGSFTSKQKEYLFEKHGITPEDLREAPDLGIVIEEVADILCGNTVTSFDIGKSVNRFLAFEPWCLTHMMTVMSSVGSGVPDGVKGSDPKDEIASINNSYDALYPNDIPSAKEGDSALDLAIRTAYILLGIRELQS